MPNDPAPDAPRTLPSPKRSDPPPDEAASSRASGRASRSESSFIGDAGPEFDPEAAPPPPPPVREAEPPPLIEWEPETIEALLRLQGRGLHAAVGVAEQDWLHTELDLAAIAPPLTRICNRYEPIQRLARYSDPLTLAFALGAYGVRSLEERREVLSGHEDTEPIAPAEEAAINAEPPPTPAPRQASGYPSAAGGPPRTMQPTEAQAPPPPRRPAEADIDPTQVEWEKIGG